MTYADACLKRAEEAKLTSDDYGHDTGLLEQGALIELCYAYDTMVPELVRRLNKACEILRGLGLDTLDNIAHELEAMPEDGENISEQLDKKHPKGMEWT